VEGGNPKLDVGLPCDLLYSSQVVFFVMVPEALAASFSPFFFSVWASFLWVEDPVFPPIFSSYINIFLSRVSCGSMIRRFYLYIWKGHGHWGDGNETEHGFGGNWGIEQIA
jgi:hypothetical protein